MSKPIIFPAGGKTADHYCSSCGAMFEDNMRICTYYDCLTVHGSAHKHTPGPWVAKNSEVYNEETGKTVARTDIGGRNEETEANAKVMAASLDTLQALMELIEAIKCNTNESMNIPAQYIADEVETAMHAIRKAAEV